MFWDKLLDLTTGLSPTELVVLGGDLNGHVGKCSDGHKGIHGGFGFSSRNVHRKIILEFNETANMTVCNTLFKKRDNRLVTYNFGVDTSAIDCLLLGKSDRRVITNVKMVWEKNCVIQRCLVVGDNCFVE
jgi:hypothetical protein